MPTAFAIIHTWPDLRNAEYEVLQRILTAAQRVGCSTVVIDDNAKVLWASPDLALTEGIQLPDDVVDFVISLHFLSPRVVDVYSYITLWQPIDFYHTFGYQKSIDSVTSHNDLISCDSDLADHHGLNLLTGLGRVPPLPLPKMFHMLPEPFLAPKITDKSKLFYIGINWERLGSAKGRFHDALVSLDRKGLTDIYGPELIHGMAVWEGFPTYRGELPFDGESVKNAINQSGICLALSSISHKSAGIMSNRLFEGLAGGAAIIATPNPLIDKYFKDVVYPVDDTRGDTVLGQQIIEALRVIHANPVEATRRVLEGQRILREVCSLEGSIRALVDGNAARIAHHEAHFLADSHVSVLLTYAGEALAPLEQFLQQFRRQKRSVIELHIICSERFSAQYQRKLGTLTGGCIRSVTLHSTRLDPTPLVFDGQRQSRARTGPLTLEILRMIETPYFAFLRLDEMIFSDHYATVVKAMIDTPASMIGCCGMISHSSGADRIERRSLHSARFADLDSIVLVTGVNQVGRFVYRSELLDGNYEELMHMLDGEEHSYFRLSGFLAGPLAQSNYATYVLNDSMSERVLRPVEPVEHQRQYIRDLFARDHRWLERLSKGTKIPEFVYAYSPGAPIRWDSYAPPQTITQRILLNQSLPLKKDGKGLPYLVTGFSWPEEHYIWMEADRGIIEFSVPDTENSRYEDFVITLKMAGRRSVATGRYQHCTFALNSMVIAYAKIPEEETEVKIPVPMPILSRSRVFRLEVTPDHAEEVYNADGVVADKRRLSLRMYSFAISSTLFDAPPVFIAGELYRFTKGEQGVEALGSGFYASESDRTWIAGCDGSLRFRLKSVPRSPQICFTMLGRSSLEDDIGQTVTIKINGIEAGNYSVGSFPEQVIVPMNELSDGNIYITMHANHAEAVFDADHEIIDGRLLGLAVCDMRITSQLDEILSDAEHSPFPSNHDLTQDSETLDM